MGLLPSGLPGGPAGGRRGRPPPPPDDEDGEEAPLPTVAHSFAIRRDGERDRHDLSVDIQ